MGLEEGIISFFIFRLVGCYSPRTHLQDFTLAVQYGTAVFVYV